MGYLEMLPMWLPFWWAQPLLGGLGPYLAAVNYEGETKRRVSPSSSPPGMEAELGSRVQQGMEDERRNAIPCPKPRGWVAVGGHIQDARKIPG